MRKWAPCSTSGPSDYGAEGSNRFNMAKSKLRQLVGLPWAADSCPWVGKYVEQGMVYRQPFPLTAGRFGQG
jgi:hypothetical protein